MDTPAPTDKYSLHISTCQTCNFTPQSKIWAYLVELLQNDPLESVVVRFLADSVEVISEDGDVQAEVKLRLIVAEGEGRVAYYHLTDVALGASWEK